MHRSGTSAAARVLNLLGVYLGEAEELLSADPRDNPLGYWERTDVIRIQDSLLSRHVDPGTLPEGWQALPEAVAASREILAVVQQLSRSHDLWGWKEPRTCLLLPMWTEALVAVNAAPTAVIVLRDPRHVAASLIARHGQIFGVRYQLAWHYYMLSAVRNSRNLPRAVLPYEDLLGDWRSAIARMTSTAKLELPLISDAKAAREIDAFLRPELNRSSGLGSAEWAAPFVRESYELLLESVQDGISDRDQQQFEDLLSTYSTYASSVAEAVKSPLLVELQSTRKELETSLEALKTALETLDEMSNSRSWRFTAPLRGLARMLRGKRRDRRR